MALDFDALRKKLNTLQGQNQRSTSLWKPEEGETKIRIVPWKERPDNPFIELYFHYLGRRTQLSPLSVEKADPIAEFGDKLRSTGIKDDWQHAKDFTPKLRTYVPIIVRGEEDQGVRFWGFGKTVYQSLLGIISDPDWGDITDPNEGRDITIKYTGKEKSDTNFPKTDIRVKPKQTPITEDAKLLKKFLSEQPDVWEVFPVPAYDELASFLQKYVDPDSDESTSAEVLNPDTAEADDDSDSDASDSTDDVAAEFEKLFNS